MDPQDNSDVRRKVFAPSRSHINAAINTSLAIEYSTLILIHRSDIIY
jgi:predicted oxidoreductase